MGAVNMDSSCERGRKSLTPQSLIPHMYFFSTSFHFVSEGSETSHLGGQPAAVPQIIS